MANSETPVIIRSYTSV